MSHRRRGFALISTFMFLGMLFMMAVSMILMSRQRIFAGMSQHHQTQALYLAEAGLAKAQVALENDLGWPGVTDATIDGMRGTYTVTLGSGKYGSVNNIGGLTKVMSYRGPGSVPPNHALLIVTANVSGHRYTLEALVEGNGSAGYMSDAILGSGKITMKGDLHVDGIAALDDASVVEGSIQSNAATGSDLVTWDGTGSALVTGNVGTFGSSSSAINMPGATILGKTELNSKAVIPTYDVESEVNNNYPSGSPVSVVSGGQTLLAGGKHSYSGPAIDGDIVLEDGAELYVKGDLTINGSISGNGTVYVDGKTTFKGDSAVNANPDFSVSLKSKGSVLLTGFDGTEFMKNQSSSIKDLLDTAEKHVEYAQTTLKSNGNDLNAATVDMIGGVGITMAGHSNHTANGGRLNLGIGTGLQKELILDLKDQIAALSPTGTEAPTKRFLEKRLEKLEKAFGSTVDVDGSSDPADSIMDNYLATGETAGLLDAVTSVYFVDELDTSYPWSQPGSARLQKAKDIWPNVVNIIHSVNYDKLGTSYFQGAIYTQGNFVANNEVQVLGAIIVDGHGTTKETIELKELGVVKGTIELEPGDIYLGKATRVTYVEEMFKEDATTVTGPQLLTKNLWMGR